MIPPTVMVRLTETEKPPKKIDNKIYFVEMWEKIKEWKDDFS